MRLVDTHCHVDLFPDPAALVTEIERSQVYTIAVTNAPSVFRWTAELARGSRYVRAAIGLHPELAAERAGELPLFWEALEQTRFVGEIGLDYAVASGEARRTQRSVFEQIVARCDALGDRILTLHSRRAADDTVELLGPRFRGVAILHWYSGSTKTLDRALGNGCFFSVNPAMARSDRSLTLMARVPRERVLLESDGPFVETDGRPATPADLGTVAFSLARLWGVTTEAARRQLHDNARTVLAGPSPPPETG
jgi:TatD DNase family protein